MCSRAFASTAVPYWPPHAQIRRTFPAYPAPLQGCRQAQRRRASIIPAGILQVIGGRQSWYHYIFIILSLKHTLPALQCGVPHPHGCVGQKSCPQIAPRHPCLRFAESPIMTVRQQRRPAWLSCGATCSVARPAPEGASRQCGVVHTVALWARCCRRAGEPPRSW